MKSIQIIKGEPLPSEVRARIDRHPLAITAHVLAAVGLAFTCGSVALVVIACISRVLEAPYIDFQVVACAAAGTLFGLVLLHQGAELGQRVIKNELHETEPIATLAYPQQHKGI